MSVSHARMSVSHKFCNIVVLYNNSKEWTMQRSEDTRITSNKTVLYLISLIPFNYNKHVTKI